MIKYALEIYATTKRKASDQILPRVSGYVSAPGGRPGETSIVTFSVQPFMIQKCSLGPQVWFDPKLFLSPKALPAAGRDDRPGHRPRELEN